MIYLQSSLELRNYFDLDFLEMLQNCIYQFINDVNMVLEGEGIETPTRMLTLFF